MTCNELRDYYELYTLGIAEDAERTEIGEHLERNCPTCVPGVRTARELISMIGAAADPVQPPARLRKRVLAIAGGQKSSLWNWSPVWAAVAAGLLIAAIVFNTSAQRASRELERTTALLQRLEVESVAQVRELAGLHEALAILDQPDARQVVFGGATPLPPRGRVFIDPKRGVLLLASNMTPAPSGKIYEMWVIPKGGKPVPAGLFQAGSDGTALHILAGPVDVATTAAVAVTLEPEAGVPQPTSTPVIAAAL